MPPGSGHPPLLATVIKTNLDDGYIAIKVQTYKGIRTWGDPFEK
jgi:hypothetical protein